MATASTVSARLPLAGPRWIESAAFDLPFFILAPLVTLPIAAASLAGVHVIPVLGFVLAFAHYLSTFAFFLWDENRERHRARWLAFFGGPALIAAVFFWLVAFRVPLAIQFVIFFWNVFHVSRQSSGILSLYRHRAGVYDPRQKGVANAAVLAANLWFALWNVETHQEVFRVFNALDPRMTRALWLAAGAVAVLLTARLAAALVRRAQEGSAPGAAELLIVGTAFALFHPYLWLPDSGGATFAMLLPHYLQYLGMVWLLHRRKFRQDAGSLPQRLLARVSASTLLLAGLLALLTLTVLAVKLTLGRAGYAEHFESFYLLLALVHFYLDGLFWAFRDPHVRRTMAPYLTGGASAASG